MAQERHQRQEQERHRSIAHILDVKRRRAEAEAAARRKEGDHDRQGDDISTLPETSGTGTDTGTEDGASSTASLDDNSINIPASEIPIMARFAALLEYLDLSFDGTPRQLNLTERLTENSDPKKRLLHQLKHARERAGYIIQDVLAYQGKSSIHDDIGDMKLIQELCVEQFPTTMRFALHRVFTNASDSGLSNDMTMHSVSLVEFIAAWSLLLTMWAGGVWFILSWAIVNNTVTVRAWFITSAIVVLSDVLVYKTAEVFLIHFSL